MGLRRGNTTLEPPRPIKPMDATEFEVCRLTLGEEGHPYPLSWLATALGFSSERAFYNWINPDKPQTVPLLVGKMMRKWAAQGYVD